MNKKQIINTLQDIRNKTYKLEGSYEESYTYIMERLDLFIDKLKEEKVLK